MDWFIQNIFKIIGVMLTTAGGVLAFVKSYFTLSNRISTLENDMKKLDEKIDDDLEKVHELLKELRNDIKILLQK